MSKWRAAIEKAGPLPSYMLIEGGRVALDGRDEIETRDPGSGEYLTAVPSGTKGDVAHAVTAAKSALSGPWADLDPKARGRLLYKAGEAIEDQVERLAFIETLDSGKPLNDARVTVQRTADFFRYYGAMVDKLEGTTVPLGDEKLCFTERIPLGVTGHIVPWNVPISMVARGLAPALACGNTAVIKPAEDTPLTAIMLVEILQSVGLPPGVVNVVTGRGSVAGQALSEHPEVDHLTFTGSVGTGKKVMTAAAGHLASVTLELGGKSPHLVLQDADLDRAVPDILKGVYKNAGQICSAGTRLLVERPIHNTLMDRLVAGAESYVVGHGLDNPDMGPLISARQLETVTGFVTRAHDRGLGFSTGGEPLKVPGCEGGHFFAPTIADNVPPDDELAQSEIFGPVLSVIPVDSLGQAIQIANGTAYGLAAGVHTADISKAFRFARAVQAGQVFVNGYHSAGDTVPFGGMKDSGIGREKGLAALNAYCQVKAVTVTL
ncbi:MAG: aldehyde dehydrogenase family protein [Pseudomonadota bacterium]